MLAAPYASCGSMPTGGGHTPLLGARSRRTRSRSPAGWEAARTSRICVQGSPGRSGTRGRLRQRPGPRTRLWPRRCSCTESRCRSTGARGPRRSRRLHAGQEPRRLAAALQLAQARRGPPQGMLSRRSWTAATPPGVTDLVQGLPWPSVHPTVLLYDTTPTRVAGSWRVNSGPPADRSVLQGVSGRM